MKHPFPSARRAGLLPMVAALMLLLCGRAALQAQPKPGDSKGTDFWVTFITNASTPPSDLRLYLSCNKPTVATITYSETDQTVTIPLPVANKAIEVNINDIFGDNVELRKPIYATEVSSKSLHVTADAEISLYGCNVRQYSADAFMALPTDVLGEGYIVLAYPNIATNTSAFNTPSEFAVIATEDGTRVTITPKIRLERHNTLAPFTVTLNRGQVYFAQARSGLEEPQDVSGTEIASNKPVAVFGGVERTAVPYTLSDYRDHLCEQIPPIDAWGKRAIITPHYAITPKSPFTSVVRVLAAFDQTSWTLDGVAQPPLGQGETAEITLTRAMSIVADNPILVAQYEHSAGLTPPPGEDFEFGDPFMMLIPPPEQFDTAYAFQSIDHSEFKAHFINVVIPTNAVGSITLDNGAMPAAFAPVPGTNFSWAQIRVGAGAHYIRADSAFGLYAYGYGRANSYGYPGGMLFRSLVSDFQSPEIESTIFCAAVEGIIRESRLKDTGIQSMMATGESVNVTVTIPPFEQGADSVPYRADLVDPYQDGIAVIWAIDSMGNVAIARDSVPGFTIRTTGMTGNEPLLDDTLLIFNNGRYCRVFELENYGRHPHTIDSVWTTSDRGGNITLDRPLPLTLLPGAKQRITVCANGWPDSLGEIELFIAEDCASRHVARLPVAVIIDTLPAGPQLVSEPCGDAITIVYTDAPRRSSGIASFTIDTLVNADAVYAPTEESFPVDRVELQLSRRDPRQDMIYQVTVVDAVGNRTVRRDTIGGFTLTVLRAPGDTIDGRSFGEILLHASAICDSVTLHNYGERPLALTNARMLRNTNYSIPPTQFPMVIQPGDSHRVQICYTARDLGPDLDTLVMVDGCGHVENLAMKSVVVPYDASGRDYCNNALNISLLAPAKRTFLQTPVPNPVSGGAASVDLGLARDASVTLELIDARGMLARQILRNVDLGAAISRVGFDVSGLQSGAYFCRLRTADGEMLVEKLVIAP